MITTNYIHTCSRCGHSWTTEIPLAPLGQLQKPVIESQLSCRACGDGKYDKPYKYDENGLSKTLTQKGNI